MGNSSRNSFNYILVFFTIITTIVFIYLNQKEVSVIKSSYDNNYYVVKEANDSKQAANILARLKQDIFIIADYLYENKEKYPENEEYIDQLYERIQDVNIIENSSDEYTSYTVNKGDQIVFCLRSRNDKDKNELHDYNLIMYVALHEISHVACPEQGHTKLFHEIFNFICSEAIKLDMYTKIDFNKKPQEYCGMTISSSIV